MWRMPKLEFEHPRTTTTQYIGTRARRLRGDNTDPARTSRPNATRGGVRRGAGMRLSARSLVSRVSVAARTVCTQHGPTDHWLRAPHARLMFNSAPSSQHLNTTAARATSDTQSSKCSTLQCPPECKLRLDHEPPGQARGVHDGARDRRLAPGSSAVRAHLLRLLVRCARGKRHVLPIRLVESRGGHVASHRRLLVQRAAQKTARTRRGEADECSCSLA